MEQQDVKKNISNGEQWLRLVYMLLFVVVLYPVATVLCVIVAIQIILALVTGETNENIRQFSASLAEYIRKIILFLTYNGNEKPFPFSAWDQSDDATEVDEHEIVINVEPVADESTKADDK